MSRSTTSFAPSNTSSMSHLVVPRGPTAVMAIGCYSLVALLLEIGPVGAAETVPSSPRRAKTELVVHLTTQETLAVQSRFQAQPPTIQIHFPPKRVGGALPERSVIQRGVVDTIHATYAADSKAGGLRWLQVLAIQLRDVYPYEVRAEPGHIVIEIEHPAEVASEAIEVGVTGHIAVSGVIAQPFLERFQAMQRAMARVGQPQPPASPPTVPWSFPDVVERAAILPKIPQPSGTRVSRPEPPPQTSHQPSSSPERPWMLGWMAALIGLGVAGTLGVWWRNARRQGGWIRALSMSQGNGPMSSAVRLIDQLVWRAFERQGYQALHTVELEKPPRLMRVLIKDGLKTALQCAGDGPFFEKASVEQFARSMRQTQVAQGVLVATGSFTVPAQRYAKEQHITLLGRDQLTELLSAGAMSEYYSAQLTQLHKQLDELKETLQQYAQQLDTIRRQRNEASWFLGEERAKSAKLQGQLDEVGQQLRHWQAQAEHWQQTAELNQKRWEESQWYLGEANVSARHLEEQLQTLQENAQRLEERHRELMATLQEAERQRDESNWYLGESRAAQEALRHEIQQLTDQLNQTQATLQATQRCSEERQQALEAAQARSQILEASVGGGRLSSERRRAGRIDRSGITVELHDEEGAALFQGAIRDISRRGFGLDSSKPMELPTSLRVRLHVPGLERPVASTGRLVWQRQDPSTRQYRAGCELSELSPEMGEAFELALAKLLSPNS